MAEIVKDDAALAPARSSRWRRWWVGLLLLALLLGALGTGFWLGRSGNTGVAEQNRQLQARLADTLSDLQAAHHRLVVYQAESQVGQQARDQLREQIRSLRDQIAGLREAVTFYKNVMAPADHASPLRIQTFELRPAADLQHFRYHVVLVQPGNSQRDLSGHVEFRLQGRRGGKPVALDTDGLLDSGGAPGFRFRYFQELAGTLTVPKGVAPVSLELIVRPDSEGKGVVRSEIPVPVVLPEAGNTRPNNS